MRLKFPEVFYDAEGSPRDSAGFDAVVGNPPWVRSGHRWGYAETDLVPAIELVGLDEATRALVRGFVPVAADEAGGFADFRETATKTNSVVDRLNALTLPNVDDVADALDRYLAAREREAALEARIERVEAIVEWTLFDLYGLTDDERDAIERTLHG